MTYTLADLPLEFRPKKGGPTGVYVVFILLEVAFAVGFEMVQRQPPAAFFTGNGLISTLAFLFMVGVCVFGIYQTQTRQDRLVIDQSGVLLHLNDVTRQWAWTDMNRFHLVLVHKRTNLHRIAIEPYGALKFDARANLIWPRFGPDTAEFLALLKAGKARWGVAAPEVTG